MERGAWIPWLVSGLAFGWTVAKSRQRLGDVLGLFTEETNVARFLAFGETAAGIRLPRQPPELPLSDFHLGPFHAPGLRAGSRPVIYYRTRHSGTAGFSVRLNSTHLALHQFRGEGPNAWHEIIPVGVLRPENNFLVMGISITDDRDAHVDFGDVVILYQSEQLTVRIPPVALPT